MKTQTQTQHTPGPWKHDPVWNLILGPNRVEIAALHGAMGPEENRAKPGTVQANARLIAASPDLLEACEQALSMYEAQLQLEAKTDSTCALLRAAIAKAIGGSL